MNEFICAVRRDLPFYAVIAAYTAVCGAGALLVGAGAKFVPFIYIARWLDVLLLLWAGLLVISGLRALRSPAPAQHFWRGLLDKGPGVLAGTLLCLGVAILHGSYTSTKTIVPTFFPFRYDVLLADMDYAFHGADPWTLLTWLNPLTDAIQPLYSVGWLLLVVLVTACATMFTSSDRLRSQYVWTFSLCWIVLGNLLSSLTLAAGPVYYSRVAGSDRFSALSDYLAQHAGPFSAHNIQEKLWTAYSGEAASFASGISAFPSMHVSMATLFTLYGLEISRSVGLAFAAFTALILLASVHLGWHYAIDGYFSIVATVGLWKAVAWLQSRSIRPYYQVPSAAVAGTC